MSITIADSADKAATSPGNDRLEDLLLFHSRMILVFGEINEKQAQVTCARLQAMSGGGSGQHDRGDAQRYQHPHANG